MIKRLLTVVAMLALAGAVFTGCGKSDEEKELDKAMKDLKEMGNDLDKASKDLQKANKDMTAAAKDTDKAAGGEGGDDVCAKAKACAAALAKADEKQKAAMEGVLKNIDAVQGAAQKTVCEQVLKGAKMNPAAPDECK